MKQYRGTVKASVVVLEDEVCLPEGAQVVVRLAKGSAHKVKLLQRRQAAIQQILDNPITHPVGIDEIMEECKKEREDRGWPQDGAEK